MLASPEKMRSGECPLKDTPQTGPVQARIRTVRLKSLTGMREMPEMGKGPLGKRARKIVGWKKGSGLNGIRLSATSFSDCCSVNLGKSAASCNDGVVNPPSS